MTEKQDAYVKKLKAKMDEWNAEIDKLEAKARQSEADSKIEYENQLADLKTKRKNFEDKITRVQDAGEGAWQDLKTGIESAWSEFDTAVKSAVSRFK